MIGCDFALNVLFFLAKATICAPFKITGDSEFDCLFYSSRFKIPVGRYKHTAVCTRIRCAKSERTVDFYLKQTSPANICESHDFYRLYCRVLTIFLLSTPDIELLLVML